MILRKFAAIDIGSNAVRLLINNVIEQPGKPTLYRKNKLIRAPVRLGEDAFVRGAISENNMARLVKAMQSFHLMMQLYEVEKYSAYATAALREAQNKQQVVAAVREACGIHIEIIDGKHEAATIAATDVKTRLIADKTYLYVDVGGGSTEFTVFEQGKPTASKSFTLGTLRLLHQLVNDTVWEAVHQWITTQCPKENPVEIIASGGNSNKLHKMSGNRLGQPLSYTWLNTQYSLLARMSYHDRILKLRLNPDRADVIVPAAKILVQAAQWSNAQKIHVPKIGLTDGMIKTL